VKKEKFSIGEKVFLIHLQQEAVIKRWSGTELLYVDVDGDEIPVYVSDVSKEIPETKEEIKVREEKEEATRKEPFRKAESSNSGIFISFSPIKTYAEEISSFDIFLINDTSVAIDFDYYFLLGEEIHFALKKLLTPYNYMMLHSIEYDLLNEIPSIQIEVRDVKNNFKGKLIQKIKPQNFFNKLQSTPILQGEGYSYKVNVQAATKHKEPKPVEDVLFDPKILKHLMTESVTAKDADVSSPVEEIDLHIEQLAKDFSTLSNPMMLQLQLNKFQQALERAIAHGANRFYAIHGVGTGKLKQEIHRLLRQYKEVKSFNNDYHPRYGFGATEVILH
jgi:hypothetical protein